jgi:hypothetical protein
MQVSALFMARVALHKTAMTKMLVIFIFRLFCLICPYFINVLTNHLALNIAQPIRFAKNFTVFSTYLIKMSMIRLWIRGGEELDLAQDFTNVLLYSESSYC